MYFNARTAHDAYQTGQISSADPLRIVILLYEGAIQFSRQALEKFDEPGPRGMALGRAHKIVSELMASLDHEKGELIARNLDSLYQFVLDALTEANVNGKRGSLQDAIKVLKSLHQGWKELEIRQRREAERNE